MAEMPHPGSHLRRFWVLGLTDTKPAANVNVISARLWYVGPNGNPMSSSTPLVSLCQQATFIKSASLVTQCPPDIGLEVAFAGRSNAGKSSALNTLTHARLARTSKTPGRTQLINFFRLDDERRLVDLPGYGYAKVSRDMKDDWSWICVIRCRISIA